MIIPGISIGMARLYLLPIVMIVWFFFDAQSLCGVT